VKAGLEDSQAALLVLVGALTDGRTVVLAVESGQRESKESWGAVLRDLRARGLKPWRCTVADGHLGIWAALAEQQPTAAEQRCWNHKIINVLDALPTKHQAEATPLLKAMPYAETQAEGERRRDQFSHRYRAVAPKAVERLHTDWERLVTFYQFPKEHWRHLRTTNVVESPFAAVRLRTTAGKRDQAGGVRHGVDLAVAPRRRVPLPASERPGAAASGLCWRAVCGWSPHTSRPPAGGCRLIPFTHLLTRPHSEPACPLRTPPRSGDWAAVFAPEGWATEPAWEGNGPSLITRASC
jgi:hypothetical protein